MRKFLGWVVIAFVVFYLFSQPHGAAHMVRGAAGGIDTAFQSLSSFVTALVG